MKKFYFIDVALASRIQGHLNSELLWNSPQVGALFETVVFSEIIKTRDNYKKDWLLYTWRTKEQNEIDFIIETPSKILFIEVKLAIHNVSSFELDSEAHKVFKGKVHKKIVVTAGGTRHFIDRETEGIPVNELGQFLLDNL